MWRRRAGRQDGQVLAVFAFGLIGIVAVAALVFDVGQNLVERRAQQDASDAAALAGARWLVTTSCKASPSTGSCPEAVAAALDLTRAHGYADAQVTINIPPDADSRFAGYPGHIQVRIEAERDAYFSGVLGLTEHRISAMAVAANIDGYAFPFSFLALNPTACKAGHAHGNGHLVVGGDVMVLSDCTSPGSLSFDGNRTVVDVAGNCGTVGDIDYGPSSTVVCGSTSEGAPTISDPLAGLQPPLIGGPAVPDPPAPTQIVSGTASLNGSKCPGTPSPATATAPAACNLQFNRDMVIRLHPGVYYGGIRIRETSRQLTVYMEPGIYAMAGGGFEVSGGVTLTTVDTGGTTYATGSGGVLIFNADGPTCATLGTNCIRAVDFQNTSGGQVRMRGYQGSVYTGILVYQHRDASSQPALSIEGNSSNTFQGTFYLPEALFKYTGNGTGEVLDSQVIADQFDIGGNGDLSVLYDPDTALQLRGTGLVQ
jgi:hypothetical protein